MKLIRTVNAGWFNPTLTKYFHVVLDPATLNRYLVLADNVVIHFVIADDGDLPSLAKASDEAHEWLDNFVTELNAED